MKRIDFEFLELAIKYDCDFTLLGEIWADEKDVKRLKNDDRVGIFMVYLSEVYFLQNEYLSEDLRKSVAKKVEDMEKRIDLDVVEYIKSHELYLPPIDEPNKDRKSWFSILFNRFFGNKYLLI